MSENSDILVKLVVKRNGFEVSTEGKVSTLSVHLDALAAFVATLTEKFGTDVGAEEAPDMGAPTIASESVVSTTEVPAIKPSKSTTDNIRALFDTPWGKTPRSLAEVAKALDVNAVPDRVPSISTSLIRLVQKGELRRVEREGNWAYIKLPSSE